MPRTLEFTRSLETSDLKDLADVQPPCITFSLPLQQAPNTSRMDYVRLKSMIRQSDQKLQEEWPELPQPQRRELIDSLEQVASESAQWGGEGGTLVVLRSPGVFRAFELKQHIKENTSVGEYFRIFPMLQALQSAEQRFYILALSQNHVRLLRCTAEGAQEVELPVNVPASFEEWLTTRSPTAAPNRQDDYLPEHASTGAFNSNSDRDNENQHIANWFRAINKAVFDLLRDDTAPMILCGVEYIRAIYRGVNQYPHLTQEGVQGSPEGLKGGEMHARALELAKQFFMQPARKAAELWESIGGTQRVSSRLPDIVKAAFEARIAHLLCADGAQAMGVFDRSTLEMKVQGREDDLVNATALRTIAFGGDVFVLSRDEMPGEGEMNAIFRF